MSAQAARHAGDLAFGDETTLKPLVRPQLILQRERPECVWLVPAVGVPLYYFDDSMLRKSW